MNKFIINEVEEICLVSLADTSVYKYYDVNSLDDIDHVYERFNQILDQHGLHDTDIEMQVMSSKTGLKDSNCDYLKDFYTIQDEQLQQGNRVELNVIIALYDYYRHLEDVRNILNDNRYHIFTGEGTNPELDAFMGYCNEVEEIENRMPEDLRNYFDYEQYYIDYKCNGMTVIELANNQYMFIFY